MNKYKNDKFYNFKLTYKGDFIQISFRADNIRINLTREKIIFSLI